MQRRRQPANKPPSLKRKPFLILILLINGSSFFLKVKLKCKGDANPPPEVTWLRDGKPLDLGDRMPIGAVSPYKLKVSLISRFW